MMLEFVMSEKEVADFDKWRKSHRCEIDEMSPAAIGGRWTFMFTPTGLGNVTVVKCACGAELEVTDVSMW